MVFCGQLDRFQDLHRRYGDHVAFLFVYIAEAPHPTPESGPFSKFDPRAPLFEKQTAVRAILEEVGFPFPCLFDGGERQVEKAYAAWPERLVIVGKDGNVQFDGGRGLEGEGWGMDEIEKQLLASLAPGSLH